MNRYHCCATCKHYLVAKTPSGHEAKCSRLGFGTNPKYQFNCWNPKDNVRKLMEQDTKRT